MTIYLSLSLSLYTNTNAHIKLSTHIHILVHIYMYKYVYICICICIYRRLSVSLTLSLPPLPLSPDMCMYISLISYTHSNIHARGSCSIMYMCKYAGEQVCINCKRANERCAADTHILETQKHDVWVKVWGSKVQVHLGDVQVRMIRWSKSTSG